MMGETSGVKNFPQILHRLPEFHAPPVAHRLIATSVTVLSFYRFCQGGKNTEKTVQLFPEVVELLTRIAP